MDGTVLIAAYRPSDARLAAASHSTAIFNASALPFGFVERVVRDQFDPDSHPSTLSRFDPAVIAPHVD